jgi:ATP-binding cassette subfamily C protein LapB
MPENQEALADDFSTGEDMVLDRLLFFARFFGRHVDQEQIISGVPLTDGRITEAELEECFARAGLSVTRAEQNPDAIKSSMLPVLIMSVHGDAVAVLQRDGDQFECSLFGVNGTHWLSLATLKRDHPGTWYFVRPVFYFDARSLLYHLPQPQQWFWDTFRANFWIYRWALIATVVLNLFASVIPFYTMSVYDRVIPNNATDSLWVLTSAAVLVTVFDLVFKLLRSHLLEGAARKIDVTLSAQIFARSLRLRVASRPASGGVLANVVRDFEMVRDFFTSTTLALFGDLPFSVFFLVLIGIISGWLVVVPLVAIPLALLGSWILQKALVKTISKNMQESAERTAHLFEVMNGLDTIKSLGAEAWARRKWESLCVILSEETTQMRHITSLGANMTGMLIGLVTVFMVMVGALMIADNHLTMGQLIAASMLSSRAITPVAQLSGLILRWQQTKLALKAINQIMEAPIDDTVESLHVPKLHGRIELRNVVFSYPNSQPVFNNLNLKIEPGERVGFIGKVGSGKSSIFKLLLNLYEPDSGSVLMDGVVTKQMEANSLRRNIGYVPQDITLFHGSIRDNIFMGVTGANDADLLQAARVACLDDILTQLPDGLGTQVGERGDRLSGGQKQTIGIARALVRKPSILLMDEPSSMMDPGTEQQLIVNLRNNLQGTTLLLTTHRMAMLPLVDRLIVMSQGMIVLDGPRDQVLAQLSGAPPAKA